MVLGPTNGNNLPYVYDCMFSKNVKLQIHQSLSLLLFLFNKVYSPLTERDNLVLYIGSMMKTLALVVAMVTVFAYQADGRYLQTLPTYK